MTDAVEAASLTALQRSSTALLTTYRLNGHGVSTPVSIAVEQGRAYFITANTSGKAKRLACCAKVSLAPCTVRGIPLGEPVCGQAWLLQGVARRRVRRLLRPTGALFWSNLLYRLRGNTMHLYEVELLAG